MDKRIRDLDDVDKLLQESPAEEIIARNRNRRRRREMERNRRRNRRRDMGIVAIPGLIVLLMVLIVILDHTTGSGTADADNAVGTEVTTETAEAESTAEGDTAAEESEEDNTVRQYNDDVLENFFQRYFEAKLNADVDTIYQMSGVANQTEEQASQLRSQLKTQAGYIEKYQDIVLYAGKGLEANDKVVFVTYNVKFRRADTLAPAIMYCYVRVNDQNEFELVENMSSEQVKLVNEYTQNNDEVKELINAQDSKLLAAISSDARLAVIYDAFQTGRIYKEDQSAIDSEVSLISVETEAETTAAETTEADSSNSDSGKSKKTTETESEEKETKSSRKKETEAETEAETTKAAKKETTAQQKDSVVEAGGDPGQSTAAGPAAAGGPAETTADAAPAQGGDVIEGQDLQ